MIIPTLLAWGALQGAATQDRQVAAANDRQACETFIAQGLQSYRRLHFQEARHEFQKAVDADPTSAAAHFYLGYTLYKIGEPTRRLTPEKVQAREEFARCFELDQSFRPVW
jgi:Tfp pilus assembly protein PilF